MEFKTLTLHMFVCGCVCAFSLTEIIGCHFTLFVIFSRSYWDTRFGCCGSWCSLFSDGDHFWLSWHCGVPHCLGCDSCSALTTDVCDKCNLRFVHAFLILSALGMLSVRFRKFLFSNCFAWYRRRLLWGLRGPWRLVGLWNKRPLCISALWAALSVTVSFKEKIPLMKFENWCSQN